MNKLELTTGLANDSSHPSFSAEETRRSSILIVDNDVIHLKVLENLLSLDRFHIKSVSTGEEALVELQHSRKWSLVLLDLRMPGTSGLEVCRRVRKQHSLFELPILMLTARGRDDDALAAYAAGANDFLAKPVNSSELRARVRTLLEMKRSADDRLRMEMALLQAQIKPHFLFNTLNSLVALSEDNPEQMRELLGEFSNYLRKSFRFDNMQPLVPLDQELQLVRSYLHIEKFRFGDRLLFDLDITHNHRFRIPPLTIQPLVENAVHHGIMKRLEGGSVRIRVAEECGELTIEVSDNGVGIPFKKQPHLLDKNISSGIGLKHIDYRLQQLFGCGITVRSEPSRGTSVCFRISKQNNFQWFI